MHGIVREPRASCLKRLKEMDRDGSDGRDARCWPRELLPLMHQGFETRKSSSLEHKVEFWPSAEVAQVDE